MYKNLYVTNLNYGCWCAFLRDFVNQYEENCNKNDYFAIEKCLNTYFISIYTTIPQIMYITVDYIDI